MSILNILTKQSPTIAGFSFDATLEDSVEMSAILTDYPVESGVRVSDHRIIQPIKYSIVGAVSNNPLQVLPTDFLGGLLSNPIASGVIAGVAGISAGWLSGTDATRASSALEFLRDLLRSGEPFVVDAVDIQLSNMVVTKISRARDPENENALIFVADLQELISLDRLPQQNQPQQSQLRDGDPAKSAIAAVVNKGQRIGITPSAVTTQAVEMAIIETRGL